MPTSPSEISKVEFNPGDFLFRENENTFHFYIIRSGEVEVFKTDGNDRKVPLAVVKEGASLGEFAMIDLQPRSASAQALSKVTAIRVSEDAYRRLLAELPEWALSIMRSLVERVRSTNEIVRRHQGADKEVMHQINVAEYDTGSRRLAQETTVDLTPDLDPKPDQKSYPKAAQKTEQKPNRKDDFDPDDTPDLA